MRRLTSVALTVGLLSPVTAAGLFLAFAYIRLGLAVSDIRFGPIWLLVGPFVILGALPAAILAGAGCWILVTLRARGLSPRNVLLLGTSLGAGCCLLITGAIWVEPPREPWVLPAVLNGAMWGVLVARHALRADAGLPVSGVVRRTRRWVFWGLIGLAAVGIILPIRASWHCNRDFQGYFCIAPLWWCHPDLGGSPHCHPFFEPIHVH